MTVRVSSEQTTRVWVAGGLTVLCLAALWIALDVTRSQALTPHDAELPITIGTTDGIVSLDPADTYDFASWEILQNVGSGLLTYVPGTTELAPGLATSMPEVSPDLTVYTFTLRSGLQFPDGTPFDAGAVKWSIDRVAALGGDPSWFVTELVSEVLALDSTTVRLTLKGPSGVFPMLLAMPAYFPVSPNCFPAGEFDPTSTCGGLGPYRIVTWTQGTSLELEAYAGYYGPQPKTASVTVQSFDNSDDLRQALEDGIIDVAWKTLTTADYEELGGDPNFSLVEGSSSSTRFLCYNTTTPPFDNAGVRTALAAALDREPVAQDVYSGTMSALYSMVPSDMWSHRDSFRDMYGQRNLTQARTLLRQAGYSETHKLEMDLWYTVGHYGPEEPAMAVALAAGMEETGMVSVTIRSADWASYRDNIGAGTMPVFLLGWYPDFLDPDNYTWPFAHSSSSNGLGIFYDNPAMDTLLGQGRTATPIQGAAREAIYVDIQELWAVEAPTVPLLEGTLVAVAQDRIRDIVISPGGMLPYFTMWRDTGLTVATSADFPPMEYISGTQIVGHDIDLMNAIAAEMSVTVVYTDVAWDDLLVGLGAGAYDAVISTLSVTPEREEAMDFTLPYVTIYYAGADENIGIAIQQGDSALRRQMNEALWELRSDGTLADIIAGITTDLPVWDPRMPDWPYISPVTGGTLVYTDSQQLATVIQIPGDAVTEMVLVAYTPVDAAAPPSGFSFANRAFDLDVYRDGTYLSSGLSLSVPATITLHYTDTDVAGLDEGSLVLERWNEVAGAWEDAACGPYDRHPDDNWLAVPICHLSRFAMFEKYAVYLPLVSRH